MKSLKNEMVFVANGKFVFLALIVPLIFATLFGYVFSNNQIIEASIAVIDEDNSLYSRQLISKLNASQYIDVTNVSYQVIQPDHLFYNEKYMAAIYLPRGLEENYYRGRQSSIGFLVDNTVSTNTTNLRSGVAEVFASENLSISMGRLRGMSYNEEQGAGIINNLALQQRLLYNPTNHNINSTVLGFVNVIALALLTMQTAQIIPRLRQEGVLYEELNNPLGIISRVLPYATTSCLTLFLVFGILKQFGGFRFVGNAFEFLIPLFLYTFVSGLIGMLLGWSVEHPSKAISRIGVVVTPSFLLSGIQAPVPLLPEPLQIFSKILPFTWYFKFIRGIGLRGGSIFYFWQELGVFLLMIAFLMLLLLLNIIRERKKQKESSEVTLCES